MTGKARGRKPSTGRYETREELCKEVWNLYLNTPLCTVEIARACRINEAATHKIINKKEGYPSDTQPK